MPSLKQTIETGSGIGHEISARSHKPRAVCGRTGKPGLSAWRWLALALPAVTAVRARLARREEKRNAVIDSATVIEAVLLVWQLASANFRLADPVLFPPPAAILALFFAELGDMLRGLLSSSYLARVPPMGSPS